MSHTVSYTVDHIPAPDTLVKFWQIRWSQCTRKHWLWWLKLNVCVIKMSPMRQTAKIYATDLILPQQSLGCPDFRRHCFTTIKPPFNHLGNIYDHTCTNHIHFYPNKMLYGLVTAILEFYRGQRVTVLPDINLVSSWYLILESFCNVK